MLGLYTLIRHGIYLILPTICQMSYIYVYTEVHSLKLSLIVLCHESKEILGKNETRKMTHQYVCCMVIDFVFGCHIDTAEQQRALNFEPLVSN